ncbi:zinc finger protein 92-like [Discoglossus pictus]
MAVQFDEIAVYFSKDEWDSLTLEDKYLYKEVMTENYQNLMSVGHVRVTPTVISLIEQGEEPYVRDHLPPVESPLHGNADGSVIWNTLGVDHNSSSSPSCVMENCSVSNIYLEAKQITHTGKNTFAFSECGECFSQASNIKEHKKSHNRKNTFLCSDCGKCSSSASNLKQHIRTHTGEKPFVCSECGRCFSQSASLNKHIKTHTGEKPFVCSKCGKCFSRSANLNRHMRTHTGEKQFASS